MKDEQQRAPIEPGTLGRGHFLKLAALLGLPPGLVETLIHNPRAAAAEPRLRAAQPEAASAFTPVRPPATPLAVRRPYVSTWQASDTLAGHWPTFWTGDVKAIAGIVRVDGQPYVFCGDPRDASGQPLAPAVTQTNLIVTPT